MIWRGILRAFNSTSYLAVVELQGSWGYTASAVLVSRSIAEAAMVPGRVVMVAVVDQSDPGAMMVLGVG